VSSILPPPTRDPDRALADLGEHGLCVVADALDAPTLARVRTALRAAVAEDRVRGRPASGFVLDRDAHNVRVWNLLNRDPLFAQLAEHPLALHLVRGVLGWPCLLSNLSGNITGPGAAAGVLHADQVFVPLPWPKRVQGLNVAWCIDDFTRENGATEVVPGSHRLHRNPRGDEGLDQLVSVEAAAGSVIAFESRLWHRSGANTSRDRQRAVPLLHDARLSHPGELVPVARRERGRDGVGHAAHPARLQGGNLRPGLRRVTALSGGLRRRGTWSTRTTPRRPPARRWRSRSSG
jgi:ectoine hydroxylase-related dioxygenase (phytanoyl-CoA dioxygenase family)